ncbi:MAG: hypothetical protein V4751_03085 [Pseudomonadota bacterium]
MEEIESLLIGIVGAFIVLGLQKAYRRYERNSTKQDIENIEFELNQLELMKASRLEMERSAFQSIFVVLTFIATAELASIFTQIVTTEQVLITQWISFTCWVMAVTVGVKFWKRYYSLKYFEKVKERMEGKLEKLRNKSNEHSS